MTLACLCLLHKLKSYSTFQNRRCLINTCLSQWMKEWMDELKIMSSDLKWLAQKSPSRATVKNWNPLSLNFYLLLPSLGTQSTCHIGEHRAGISKEYTSWQDNNSVTSYIWSLKPFFQAVIKCVFPSQLCLLFQNLSDF